MQSTCSDCKNKKSRFKKKKQVAKGIRKKKLNCKFIRINTSRIHTFISTSNKNKIKKLKLQLANLNVQNNDDNDDNDNNNNNNNKIKKYCLIFYRYTL